MAPKAKVSLTILLRKLQSYEWYGMFKEVMIKQKLQNNHINQLLSSFKKPRTARQSIVAVLLVSIFAVGTVVPPMVQADQYDEQIKQLQAQNSANLQKASELQQQAQTYQQAIDQLQLQISVIEGQINENQLKRDDLQRQIDEAEAELTKQKHVLGENIKTMYLEGQISTLEMLASSKDLSDFVDRQQYRSTVQDKIKDTLDRINKLKAELKNKKQEVDNLLQEQQTMQAQLNSNKQKQSEMLAYTQAQKSDYENQIRTTSAQINSLRAQQAAFYARITGGGTRTFGSAGNFQFRALSAQQGCGGGYSYCWAYHDQAVNDTWGLFWARECVHYAADRAARGVNLAPYFNRYAGAGNATNWTDVLSGRYVVDRVPSVGAVAIAKASDLGNPYGHAMYVEYVLNDGWVGVSQMNWDGRGSYSTMEIKSSGVWFIHF